MLIETRNRLFIHCFCVQLLFTMHNTLSSEQANQIDTTEEIQTGFESVEFSGSGNQEIHDKYFVHKNTEIWIPGHDKKTYTKQKLLATKTIDQESTT